MIETRFNSFLVLLSILVAIFASYVALNLSHSVTQAKGRVQSLWLSLGSCAMGIGIWSMHFIGMLAFEMPGMTMAYDLPLLILSVIVAIGASALALYIISRTSVPMGSIISGGIAMAAAIAGMHYIGMYSMRMAAAIKWNVYLVVLSILIALAASFGSLFVLIRLRNKADQVWELLLASTLMGFAISGMHYTGMFAATFIRTDRPGIESSNLIVSSGLTLTVITTTLVILGIALASSVNQRLWLIRSKRAHEILGKSEEKFRRLVEAVKDYAIFMLNPDGYITTWNSGAERITGYLQHEAMGKHVSLFYPNAISAKEEANSALRQAAATEHFETEGRRLRKDGSMYWASIVITPLYERGKLAGYSNVTRDITIVKESEQRLRQLNEELEYRIEDRTKTLAQRENQLRSITNALPVLIAEMDAHERCLFANDAFGKWFGYSAESVIGKQFRDLLGEERYPYNEPFVRKVLQGEVTTYERKSSDGQITAILSITFVPVFDEYQSVTGFVLLATDITKYKEIQDELSKAKEAAEVANATKSAFLANMSHEIRTPLGAILGFSELLLDNDITPEERSNGVDIIKRNGLLLSNIINDILDLSKVEAGKLDIEKVEIPFGEIMKEIGSVLNFEAAAKGIELKVTAEGMLPNQIKTDPLRLRQILLNIIGNAIKFTAQGSVSVKVKLLGGADGTEKLAFIIKDTGEGIPPARVERLFTPFSQADVSTTRKFGGTGLGLVLSKKLAKMLGGDVVLVETEPGKGSTFMVTINPGVPEQILFASSPPAQHPKVLAKKKENVSLNHIKILVADDSPDNQALVRKILTNAGATVETANNGKEAIAKAEKDDFSIILMDLQMPEMDGYEATKFLRQGGYTKPIVALTAHAMREEKRRSQLIGFDAYMTKPIDRDLLIKTLAQYPP